LELNEEALDRLLRRTYLEEVMGLS